MVSLGLSGIVLFAVSVAALAAPDTYREQFFEGTWRGLSSHDKQVSVNIFSSLITSLSPSPSVSLSVHPKHL